MGITTELSARTVAFPIMSAMLPGTYLGPVTNRSGVVSMVS